MYAFFRQYNKLFAKFLTLKLVLIFIKKENCKRMSKRDDKENNITPMEINMQKQYHEIVSVYA